MFKEFSCFQVQLYPAHMAIRGGAYRQKLSIFILIIWMLLFSPSKFYSPA